MRAAMRMLLSAGALAAACAPTPERDDVIGSYTMSIATDTLHLDSSGAYRRVFVRGEAPQGVAVDTGRWWLSKDGRHVGLSALPRRWPEHGRYDPVSGAWHQPDTLLRGVLSLRIHANWSGDLSLDVIPELDWRYRRVRR